MIATAFVTRCTARQDGRWLVVATLDKERRPITVVSPKACTDGQRITVDGAGVLWHMAEVSA